MNAYTAEARAVTAPYVTTYPVATSAPVQAVLSETHTMSDVGKELRAALVTTIARTMRPATELLNNVMTFVTNQASADAVRNA